MLERYSQFAGKRILLVEDDWFLAILAAQELQKVGANIVGPVPDVESALQLIRSEPLDGALLDVELGDETSFPAAELLLKLQIPFVFASSCGPKTLPAAFVSVPNLGKTFDVSAAAQALFGRTWAS